RVDDTAWQQQCIKVLRLRFTKFHVNQKVPIPFREVPASDIGVLGRHDQCLGATLIEGAARPGKLDLFKPVGDEDGDFKSFKSVLRHAPYPFDFILENCSLKHAPLRGAWSPSGRIPDDASICRSWPALAGRTYHIEHGPELGLGLRISSARRNGA